MTTFSPSRVNGFAPSASLPVGTVAYQKRRRTFCLVQIMDASSRGWSRCQTRYDARRVVAELSEVNPRNRAIVYDDAAAHDQESQMGLARGSDWSDERIVQTEIARMR